MAWGIVSMRKVSIMGHYLDRNKRYKIEILARTRELKQKCHFCLEAEVCCLDFHHLEPGLKEFCISYACNVGYSWKRILEEVKKCVVVCKNCHAKLHEGIVQL